MNKEKSLYDEIFMTNEAPDIKDTNSSKDIKDAIDDANLNDTVGMEDIFVFDDKDMKENNKKEVKAQEEEPVDDAIKLEDAKFFDLINNTLVDLRLDLDKVNLDNELASMKEESKDNVSPLVSDHNKKDANELDKTIVNNITFDDFKESKDNISPVVEAPKEVKSKSKLFPWFSYVLVVLLVLVAIGGSLTFLVRQFK